MVRNLTKSLWKLSISKWLLKVNFTEERLTNRDKYKLFNQTTPISDNLKISDYDLLKLRTDTTKSSAICEKIAFVNPFCEEV